MKRKQFTNLVFIVWSLMIFTKLQISFLAPWSRRAMN